jgi:UDP-glucose 4-epimerase
VTGAGGFIGRALCARLASRGRAVTAVLRRPAQGPWDRVHVMELGVDPVVPSLFESVDTVYHLAARVHQTGERPTDAHLHQQTNVDATRELLEHATRANVRRFVFFSSIKAMGEFTDGCDDEDIVARPVTPYGKTKLAAEQLVLAHGDDASERMQAVVLRLSVVYGAGSKGNVTSMLRQIRRGLFPPLPDFGNRRSMVHVDDVVDVALLAAQHANAGGGVFIVSDGVGYDTRTLYEVMCEALGRPVPRWSVPVWVFRLAASVGDLGGTIVRRRLPFNSAVFATLRNSAHYSSQRLSTRLGFSAKFSLREGMVEMAASLDRHGGGKR